MKSWNLYSNHRLFVGTVFGMFLFLSVLIAVQPAARIEGVLRLPCPDELAGPQRPADDQRRRFVHTGEGRIIGRAQAEVRVGVGPAAAGGPAGRVTWTGIFRPSRALK